MAFCILQVDGINRQLTIINEDKSKYVCSSLEDCLTQLERYDTVYLARKEDFKGLVEESGLDIQRIEKKIEDYTEITKSDTVDIDKLIEAIKLGEGVFSKVKMSGGYLAYQLIRRFSDRIRILTKEEREIADKSFVGGRVEAVWEEWEGDIVVYDINSAYPYLLAFADIPDTTKKPMVVEGIELSELASLEKDYTGIVEADIEEYSVFPVLPVRIDGEVYFPEGVKSGWWFSSEVVFAGKVSDIEAVNIKKAILYPKTTSPFTDMILELTEMRYRYKEKNEYFADMLKKALNSLYGLIGKRSDEKFSLSNRIIAGYITALQRTRLLDAVIKVYNRGAEVLYYDTDSIIVDVRSIRKDVEEILKPSSAFGSWSIRFDNIKKFVCGGVRQYMLIDKEGNREIRWKGVPLSASDIEEIDIKQGRAVLKRLDVWKGVYIRQEVIHTVNQKRNTETGNPFRIVDGKLVKNSSKKIKIS